MNALASTFFSGTKPRNDLLQPSLRSRHIKGARSAKRTAPFVVIPEKRSLRRCWFSWPFVRSFCRG